jgi:hypothetical protein
MAQKEVSVNNDKILLPIFIVSLIFISIMVGNFVSTFILSLISIIIISFIYSIIQIRKFDKELINKIKESSYILSFSFLTTLIIATILPYVLLHNSFVNIYLIQYVYLLPILFIFFSSLYIYSALIHKTQPEYAHILKFSLIITIIISIVISLFLAVGSNYIYNQRTEIYNENFEQTISELNDKTTNLYQPDYQIFNEIKLYQDNFLDAVNKQKNEFQTLDENRSLCIATNCAKTIVDKAYHLIVVVVNSVVIQGTLEQANEEIDYINSEEFNQNFTSLEEYKSYLKDQIDASEFTISSLLDENKNTLNQLESEFTYKNFKKLIEETTQKQESAGMIGLFSESGSIFETNSLFYNGLSYAIQHSIPFKELFRLVIKASIYTGQQGKNPDLFVQIYENKDIEESTESKVIRYKLILDRIER